MSTMQILRAFANQRLTAAVEEIFGLFERTIAEYEEEVSRSKQENDRQRKLLDAVFNPHVRLQRTDIQQLLVSREEVLPEQQQWSSSLDQEDPEPPHIKEDQEELWTSQEGEQLQGLEEADITKLPFTPVPVKSEDDEEEPQSSQLHQSQSEENREAEPLASTSTEQMKTEADGEDCGGPEPASNLDPASELQPTSDDQLLSSHCSEPQSGLDTLKNNTEILVIHKKSNSRERRFSCSVCDKIFGLKGHLKRHMTIHTREKPFDCKVCGEIFGLKGLLQSHMRSHTKDRLFGCSVCGKIFGRSGHLQRHMTCHTREKPFDCKVCGQAFSRRDHLQKHIKSFSHGRNVVKHD